MSGRRIFLLGSTALYSKLPPKSSQYSTARPTTLDKIQNLYAAPQVGIVGGRHKLKHHPNRGPGLGEFVSSGGIVHFSVRAQMFLVSAR